MSKRQLTATVTLNRTAMRTPRSDEWTDPGAHEVVRGIYRIPLPLPNDGLRAVNVYLVVGSDEIVCIDSGWSLPESRELFEASLASLECGPEDVDRFLVTHVHRDHYTQALSLRKEFRTHVSLGVGERISLDVMLGPGYTPFTGQIEELRANGAAVVVDTIARAHAGHPPPAPSNWEYPDDWLREGDSVQVGGRLLEVLETPGHTRGHVVFHDFFNSILFAGDHVLPTITPSIGFEVALPGNPLGDFLGSLAKVRELPDAMLLPAHGPVAPSVHARIDELVDHHGVRLEQCLAALQAGADTPYEVARYLRWTRRERNFDELDPFNQVLAVSETAAHLVLLLAQGRIRHVVEDGLNKYDLGR
jgi:glyoxylase-like metal-dependent hydrolase (beta-lactamase superfamily II)